jgi:hypothetical protein
MHQQLWGYKVEWKSVSRGTGGKKVEYHWSKAPTFGLSTVSSDTHCPFYQWIYTVEAVLANLWFPFFVCGIYICFYNL